MKQQDSLLTKATEHQFKNRDSAIYYFKNGYARRIQEKDSIRAVRLLIELSALYAHNVDYEKSYNGYWKALILAEKSKNLNAQSDAYLGLGWLYSFFKRNDAAVKYFNKSLRIKKGLVSTKKLHENFLCEVYFSMACHYRENNKFTKANKYLDSLRIIKEANPNSGKSYYYESESAYLASINGFHDSALKKLNNSKVYFETHDPSYLVIIYSLLGEVYKNMQRLQESQTYFKKALETSYKYNSHVNYRLKAYQSLYKLNKENNHKDEALHYLLRYTNLKSEIYGIDNKHNQFLFEIKDKYRLEKEQQQDLIDQQKIKKLEQEEKIWFWQLSLLFVVILALLIFGFLFIKYLRNKHKNEKTHLLEKQKTEIKRQNDIIEIKNKELTESALRLIEKDEFISNIKTKLDSKDHIDINVLKRLIRSFQGNTINNWLEFEARFTSINKSFYECLKAAYPNLKKSDLRICALVKLHFSSKDMSKLLGISIDSVHTLRHKLRKKLGLSRKDNLDEFISKF
ncbi:tetratricopeptide repeat protein [Tamlana sp. 2_MG-2023]|uniref:tetratricopeptide repeat protein n=1 Tax=Tamlana sp. 2_MG-2023 TaxID=3062683 RepID=UPI0026E36875|nr:tetratricopeptide repeat protein [Tamlana sp. 2_MG-2023]MDO6760299.1 tetratricopeptide repeat protein [Tamlana sp. 2_MG-2023]MDO6790003.1 tetratricopeptide repeat protein [Tamlana sp. 1_MG-2023]